MKTDEQEFKEMLGELFIAFGKLAMAFVVMALGLIFGGYVTMYLWNGIIAPTFGIVTLTIAQGIGIDLFITFTTMQRVDVEDKGLVYSFFRILFTNILMLFVGWIVIQFI